MNKKELFGGKPMSVLGKFLPRVFNKKAVVSTLVTPWLRFETVSLVFYAYVAVFQFANLLASLLLCIR